MYDPRSLRFLSPDPLNQYPSPYAYVGNNPISFVDPSGMGSKQRGQDLSVDPYQPSINSVMNSTLRGGDLTGGSSNSDSKGYILLKTPVTGFDVNKTSQFRIDYESKDGGRIVITSSDFQRYNEPFKVFIKNDTYADYRPQYREIDYRMLRLFK